MIIAETNTVERYVVEASGRVEKVHVWLLADGTKAFARVNKRYGSSVEVYDVEALAATPEEAKARCTKCYQVFRTKYNYSNDPVTVVPTYVTLFRGEVREAGSYYSARTHRHHDEHMYVREADAIAGALLTNEKRLAEAVAHVAQLAASVKALKQQRRKLGRNGKPSPEGELIPVTKWTVDKDATRKEAEKAAGKQAKS